MTDVEEALLRFRVAMRFRRELGRASSPAEVLAEQAAATRGRERGRIPIQMIERLEADGLIERAPQYRLTESGLAMIANVTSCGCHPDAIHSVHHSHQQEAA